MLSKDITEGRETPHLDAVLEVASHFGLSKAVASGEIKRIRDVLSGWKEVFITGGADEGLLRRVDQCFKQQAKTVTR